MSLRPAMPLLISACLWAQPVATPDTPAGHTLQAWLDAFNSGNRGRLEAYLSKYEPSRSIEQQVRFRDQTGGFELIGVDKSEPLHIEFRVKEKNGSTTAVGTMDVKDADPGMVAGFRLLAVPPGAMAADMNMRLDAAARGRVIDAAISNLNEYYIFPDVAKKMEEALRAHQKQGDYDAIVDGFQFGVLLTKQLRDVSHDMHLAVNFSRAPLPKPQAGPDPEADARRRAQLESTNCSFEKVELLPPNIGYLKFNAFMDAGICGPTASAAMNFLAKVDAIIFDLRGNGGGDPRMVAYISTYLFDKPTHLNDLYNRKEDATTEYWTLPEVPGKRLTGKPAFILTSKRTFSGAEEFTYNLKNLKRATIIGETTGGGAHPVSPHRIDDHFTIGVPFARAVNPITKTNWEGTGVEPDVQAPAGQALAVAKKMALEEIRNVQAKK